MDVEKFFELFLDELKSVPEMRGYYKFLNKKGNFYFRKNYFCNRLNFIKQNAGSTDKRIWDCGCGYGTTAIFLALNGYKIHGSTLERYFETIEKRVEYWSKIKNISNFTYKYEDVFDTDFKEKFDRVIVQDTLHHLEPIDKAIKILYRSLKPGGKLLVIEENGGNIFLRILNYLRRGNQRVVEFYDEHLHRKFLMGNENIRPFHVWEEILKKNGFNLETYEYIKYYLPRFWNLNNYDQLRKKEKNIWRNNKIKRNYLFWGINFVMSRGNLESSNNRQSSELKTVTVKH